MGSASRAVKTVAVLGRSSPIRVKRPTRSTSKYTLGLERINDSRMGPFAADGTPVVRYRVTGLPAEFGEIRIAARDGRWQIHRDIAKGWKGNYASAEDALEAIKREFARG
jgi:hypothetical protein